VLYKLALAVFGCLTSILDRRVQRYRGYPFRSFRLLSWHTVLPQYKELISSDGREGGRVVP